MRDKMQQAVDARDRKPSAEPKPRNDWIRERLEKLRERLEKLRQRDELLRQIGYIKPEEAGNE